MMVKIHNSQAVKILALHTSDGKTLLLAGIQLHDLKYILSKVATKGNKSILLVVSPCVM